MAHEPTRDETRAERAQMGRRHIFVVNGEPALLNLMRDLLQSERYNVTTTNFLPATIEQIAALRPDLLVIDLAVGARAGWELLAELRHGAATRRIPVLVVSTSEALIARARADPATWGGDRFLAKPFDIKDVLAAVDELIGTA